MSLTNHFSARLSAYIAVALFSGTSLSASANGNGNAVFTEQALIAQGAQISHHRLTGQANFIGTQGGNAIALPGTGTSRNASAVAMEAINAYGPLFGLSNPAADLSQKSFKTTANGRSVVRYQQNYNGIPVIGGELIVNLSKNNGLLSINGEIAPKQAIPTTATITAQQASDTALAAVAKWHQTTTATLAATSPVLSVYDPKLIGPNRHPASLVWHLEVSSKVKKPIRELVLIDAQRGSISLHFNQIDTAMVRETYTAAETAANPGTLVCNESDPTCSAGDTDAQNAHQFAKDTYDFYSTNHARDSIDGAGMTIISTTHWDDGTSCPNAFWDGSRMVYCTGLVVDDVVAHELTHGVTSNTSNLFYYYQSGAINESLSDVWGEFVDLSNTSGSDTAADRWLMGEDINVTGLVGPIRSMKDPTLYSDPDKMSSTYYNADVNFLDNGGVHTNSGINNKAVYLMVDGDTFNGRAVSGLGITKVATIYYEVQTNLLTSGADYLDLYNALFQGCQNVIGTAGITANDCVQVRTATEAVEMNTQPSTNFNPDAAMCPTGQGVATTTFSDNMEGGFTNWTLATTGVYNWTGWNATYGAAYGPNATSGVESLFAINDTAATEQSATISVTLPAGTPYLHFRHAYDLEYSGTSYYDGAVLQYSTNAGTSWTNASSLIDAGKTTDGTIAVTGWSNPLENSAAFGGTSNGYVSTRLNLSSLAGLPVQFRWSVATDSSNGSYGWWLDDVNIYICSAVNTMAFNNVSYTVAENGTSATITVSRSGSTTGAISVDYAVASGSATAGSDFTGATGTLSWANGDAADKTFTVTINDDAVYEGDEIANLALSNPVGGILGTNSSATLTITDNDPISYVAFSNATYTVAENGASATVTVSRTGNTNGPASVTYTASSGTATAGSDFTATTGTVSWVNGDSADKSFTVAIIDDTSIEGNEVINLALSSPVNAVIGTQSSATLTITDNDASSGGGGGGAFGWPFLLFGLLLLPLRRRLQPIA